MLFLIDFLKKDVNFFPLFSDFFPHYVCVVFIKFDLLAPPSIESQFISKRKKEKKE